MSPTFIAIGAPQAPATPQALAPQMRAEIEAVWRDDTSGPIGQSRERADARGFVMVRQAPERSQVEATLARHPLVEARLLDLQIVEPKPFALWPILFGAAAS